MPYNPDFYKKYQEYLLEPSVREAHLQEDNYEYF